MAALASPDEKLFKQDESVYFRAWFASKAPRPDLWAPPSPLNHSLMQLLASYPYLNLYLHEGAFPAIEAQWNGYAGSVLLRRATVECVNLARDHHITGWIADDRLLGPLRPVDLEWTGTFVVPLLVKMGLRRFAHLAAVDPLTQRLISQAQESATHQLPFELRSFTDLQAARAWACG